MLNKISDSDCDSIIYFCMLVLASETKVASYSFYLLFLIFSAISE